jgi:hypothetical protein
MAIALANNLGSTFNGSNATTVDLTTGASVASGACIAVLFNANQSITSVTDQVGNTYVLEFTQSNGGANACIAHCVNATALPSGNWIRVTIGSAGRVIMGAASFTGVATSSVLDQENGRNQFAALGWDSNNITTTNNDDLILGVCAMGGAVGTSTPGTNYTELHDLDNGISSMTSVYRIVAATLTTSANGTWTNATGSDQATAVISLKAAAGTPISKTLTPALETDAAQALGFTQGGVVYENSWGDMGIEYGMLPFSGENFPLPSGRRRYSLPPMSP